MFPQIMCFVQCGVEFSNFDSVATYICMISKSKQHEGKHTSHKISNHIDHNSHIWTETADSML